MAFLVRADEMDTSALEAGLPTLLGNQPHVMDPVKPRESAGGTPTTSCTTAQDNAETFSMLSTVSLPTFKKNGPQQSVGSLLHPDRCQPCVFYCFKRQGCGRGVECQYCHFEHVSKQAVKREAWHERNRQRIERYNQARSHRDDLSEVSSVVSMHFSSRHQTAPQWRQPAQHQTFVAQHENNPRARGQFSGEVATTLTQRPAVAPREVATTASAPQRTSEQQQKLAPRVMHAHAATSAQRAAEQHQKLAPRVMHAPATTSPQHPTEQQQKLAPRVMHAHATTSTPQRPMEQQQKLAPRAMQHTFVVQLEKEVEEPPVQCGVAAKNLGVSARGVAPGSNSSSSLAPSPSKEAVVAAAMAAAVRRPAAAADIRRRVFSAEYPVEEVSAGSVLWQNAVRASEAEKARLQRASLEGLQVELGPWLVQPAF